ncbi:nuclear transport factor 2 family protein [Nocardia pseudovaccinii]|uniref:nuclear transport factor 2 family protein n=1 Tax=Nocardia pseudovaccinii TaxID=189540 RepID=UPI003D8C15A4
MNAEQVVRELIARFATSRFAEAYELYAPAAEISVEFAFPERVVVTGTEGWSTTPPRLYSDLEVRDLVVYRTDDPAVVIAEWTYVSQINGQLIENGNIVVVEVRDGLIVRSRDYHDHLRRALADGTAPDLAARLQAAAERVDGA